MADNRTFTELSPVDVLAIADELLRVNSSQSAHELWVDLATIVYSWASSYEGRNAA
jgi:hypothetical protein